MGYKCTNNSMTFRVIELRGQLCLEGHGTGKFDQVLLLHDDEETLSYVRRNLTSVVNRSISAKKLEFTRHITCHDDFKEFCGKMEPLIDAIIMKPENNLFPRMEASMKKAILSIAIERCHADRSTICNALGLSDGQLDEELRLCGLIISDEGKKSRQ